MMELEALGIGLLLAGVALLIAAILMSMSGKTEKREVEGGAVIIIGPIPILIASSKKIAFLLIAITLILAVIIYVLAWAWISYG